MSNRSLTGLRVHLFVPAAQFPPCAADPHCNSDPGHACAAQHPQPRRRTFLPRFSDQAWAGHPRRHPRGKMPPAFPLPLRSASRYGPQPTGRRRCLHLPVDARMTHPGPALESAQLAVLAAAPVVSTGVRLFQVVRLLAGHAKPHARHCLASGFGNGRVALLAVKEPRTLRQFAAGPLDCVLDGGVDLVLHGAVASQPVAMVFSGNGWM